MRVRLSQIDKSNIVHQAAVHRMDLDFTNLTSSSLCLPEDYFTPACFEYSVKDALIAGNRSCIVGDKVYIDTPIEWGYQEFLSYVARVKKVHRREFSFLDGYVEESGEGELHLPRPYIHIEEEVFFCGCVEYWNFGFFLTVLMQKVFVAQSIDVTRPVLVPICSEWQVKLLKKFFPTTKFVFFDPNQVVSVSSASVVSWPGFGFHISENYLKYMREMVVKIGLDGTLDRPYIWLARREGIYGKRFELTKALGQDLISTGYSPIYPEILPPERVGKMINGAESIILDSGSALFNLIFAGSNAQVILLESRAEFLLNHSRFLNSCGIKAKVIFADETSRLEEVMRSVFPTREDMNRLS